MGEERATITTIEIKNSDKHLYMPLLLIGDESESMIARYLGVGTLYAGMAGGVPVAVCVTVELSPDRVEVKNLAVRADMRRKGIGRLMLRHVEETNPGKEIILGTGETPSTLRFYSSCGYEYSHSVPGFFTENYPEPIIEEGVRLRDMIYLRKAVKD